MNTIPFSSEFPVHLLPSHTIFPADCLSSDDSTASHPLELRRLLAARPTLYVQGQKNALDLLTRLPEQGLGVVGTRRASPCALSLIESVVADLAGTATICVSGFALGVDQKAHWAAVRNGLPTVAFLGTPLDRDYPRGSLALRRKILETGGLLLSEAPPSSRVFATHFLERNRWIAALSRAIWLVQAPIKSGARSTVVHARAMRRSVYVTPAFPGDDAFGGNMQEFENHPSSTHLFLGARSLSETWLGLLSELRLAMNVGIHAELEQDQPEQGLLAREIGIRTRLEGGVSLDRLVSWACDQGWEFPDFYGRLAALLEGKQVIDSQGWFTSKKSPSKVRPHGNSKKSVGDR